MVTLLASDVPCSLAAIVMLPTSGRGDGYSFAALEFLRLEGPSPRQAVVTSISARRVTTRFNVDLDALVLPDTVVAALIAHWEQRRVSMLRGNSARFLYAPKRKGQPITDARVLMSNNETERVSIFRLAVENRLIGNDGELNFEGEDDGEESTN